MKGPTVKFMMLAPLKSILLVAVGSVIFLASLKAWSNWSSMEGNMGIAGLEVITYRINEDTLLRKTGANKWAIRRGSWCLTKRWEWEFELLPSGRSDAYLKRTRFDSPEEALAFWEKGDGEVRE